MERPSISRRSFLKGASAAAGGAIGAAHASGSEADPRPRVRRPARVSGETEVELSINGAAQKVKVEPRTTLLAALRHRCEPPLTGTKEVCDGGACGACTVLIDGEPRYSCMTLALDAVGHQVRTVEGLAEGDKLSPVQEAFWVEDALMCGFCTPGFVMSVTACLEENPQADEAEVRQACSGNLCRCGTYPHIFSAAAKAGVRMGGRKK